MSPSWINWEGEEGVRYTAHYTVPDWQCLHSGLGHGVRAHQDVLKEAHSGILCILPIRYSSANMSETQPNVHLYSSLFLNSSSELSQPDNTVTVDLLLDAIHILDVLHVGAQHLRQTNTSQRRHLQKFRC